MRGYSHLSDDEREQIGLLKVLGHSIGAIMSGSARRTAASLHRGWRQRHLGLMEGEPFSAELRNPDRGSGL